MAAKKGPVAKAAEAVKGAAEAVGKAAEKHVIKPAEEHVVKPVAKAVGLGKGKKATPKKK